MQNVKFSKIKNFTMLNATFGNFWVLLAQMLKIGIPSFQDFSQIFPLKLYNNLTLSNPYWVIIYII